MNHYAFSALLLGIILILILLRFGIKAQRNNIWLAACLFCLCYAIVATWLISSETLRQVPWLTRLGNFFGYFIYSCLFFFVRNTFYPGKLWHPFYWLMLLPAAFYLVDMFPFFMLPADQKLELFYANYKNGREQFLQPEGWLAPPVFHYVFRVTWSLFVYVLIVGLIIRNRHYDLSHPSSGNRAVFRFIILLAIQFLPLTIVMNVGTLFLPQWWNMKFFNILLSIPMLGTGIFLLFSPGFVYGFRKLSFEPIRNSPLVLDKSFDKPVTVEPESEEQEKDAMTAESQERVAKEVAERYQDQLIAYLEKEKPYLQKGITIHLLSQQCNIPVYVISAIVNNQLNTNFNSWINRYRVNHFIALSQLPLYEQYTAEALASEAGFTGRATFHTAFKREMGITPGQFLRNRAAAV